MLIFTKNLVLLFENNQIITASSIIILTYEITMNERINMIDLTSTIDRVFFSGKLFSGKDDLWHVCKSFFPMHGQSFIGRGFSVSNKLVDANMKETSLISQRYHP